MTDHGTFNPDSPQHASLQSETGGAIERAAISPPEEPTCGMCGLPISDSESGVRHFGFYTAHMERRCIQLLKMEIERLRHAADADDRKALWRVMDMVNEMWTAIPGCLLCDSGVGDKGCTKQCAYSRYAFANAILGMESRSAPPHPPTAAEPSPTDEGANQ